MKLLEIGKDWVPEVRSVFRPPWNRRGYRRTAKIYPKRKTMRIKKKVFKELVRRLQKAYPKHNYRLEERKIKGVHYWIIRRGKVSPRNPPLYYSYLRGKFYVPRSYTRKRKELVANVIRMRLQSLGAARVRWK